MPVVQRRQEADGAKVVRQKSLPRQRRRIGQVVVADVGAIRVIKLWDLSVVFSYSFVFN